MPYNMPNPTLDLPTKYGVLVLTFLDPSGVHRTNDRAKHVLGVEGVLVINRVRVRVCMWTYYGPRFRLDGNELTEQGERMNNDYQRAYNRRVNELGQMMFGTALPPGVLRVLDDLVNGEIRTAYEAHPELQVEAQRARLAQAIDAAEADRDRKYEQYKASEDALRVTRNAFGDFNEAHPMSEGTANA